MSSIGRRQQHGVNVISKCDAQKYQLLAPKNKSIESEEEHFMHCEFDRRIGDHDREWLEWLWETDPLQECYMETMLNRMHLLGLLICRWRARTSAPRSSTLLAILFPRQQIQELSVQAKQLCLFDNVAIKFYTLRQLLDTLENLQIQWTRNREHILMLETMEEAVDALFHRFGTLTLGHASSSSCYDDVGSMEPYAGGVQRISKLCIRKVVNTFLILYRHMHCWKNRVCISMQQEDEEADCGIKLHHILASSDDFAKMSMHWDLIPAARLTYMHDFRGLYNCVSQVCMSFFLFSFLLFV